MAQYRVIEFFTDLQDNDYPYNAGDVFPRKGKSVTADRIAELSGTQNKRGVALIEEVRVEKETAETAENATVSKKEIVEPEFQPDEIAPVGNEPRKRGRKSKEE
jgi:hypothetical protein